MSASSIANAETFPPLLGVVAEAPSVVSHSSDPDTQMMVEAAAGSEAAFAELVRRHHSPLLNYFARMGARTDGEDLVQETLVRLFRYRSQYQPTARFSTFLYHLARNVWADRGRKVIRMERIAVAYEEQMQTAVAEPAFDGTNDVEAALARLSQKLREVIVLNTYQGLRYQEVADVLGIPLGTVKSRINLALTELRKLLHED